MATPISDQDSQWDLIRLLYQHEKALDESGNLLGTRRDVLYAMIFMVSDTPTVYDAVNLFWNMYQPRLYPSPESPNLSAKDIYLSEEDTYKEINPLAPAPPAELNELLLDCLDWMYDKYGIPPYEPDADDSENLMGLVIKLHIAAARAFKLKQVDSNQMSEEWMSTLRSVERTMGRINAIASPYWYPSFAASTDAIWGMTQLELSRISRADGSYADAIDYLTQSAYSYIGAFDNLGDFRAAQVLFGIEVFGDAGSEDKHSRNPWTSSLDWDEETAKNKEVSTRRDIESRFTPLQVSLEDTASLFNLLKQSAPTDANWREIAEYCEGLAVLPLMDRDVFTGVEDFVENEEGNLNLSWSEFWYGAASWATAQLSPSEYHKMLKYERESAAETRLKNYFFDINWSYLPERAQRGLITADILLNLTPGVRLEGLLNELRIATEEMCYQVVWQHLDNSRTPPLEFIREKLKLDERSGQSDLGISDYIRICGSRWYRDFLNQQSLDRDDVKFLTSQLPQGMGQLRSERNVAEHEIGTLAAPDSPQSFYRGFLGIGRPGILPELAQIGRKLQAG